MQTDVGGFFIHDGNAEVRVKRIEKEPEKKKKKTKKTKKVEKSKEHDFLSKSNMDVDSDMNSALPQPKNDLSPSKVERPVDFEFPPALKAAFNNLESKAKTSNLSAFIFYLECISS
jgi:hypothetical protein